MLVLTRNEGEKILIGDDITIVVFGKNKHGEIKIGIDAPREMKILRAELDPAQAREPK